MSRTRLIACVLLPFAAGYYLSYLFRTINALIANDLTTELKLSAGDLGFLTSVYFLVFTAVQLPFGALLDRYGPRTIQSTLLLLTSAGALVFALADGFLALLFGRALIGLGVAIALMSGFKAIVLWFPPERLALANGWLVMLGALGALTATGPAELIIQSIGWRGLFALLAGLSALAALLVLFAVPEPSVPLMLQLAALAWFATPQRLSASAMGRAARRSVRIAHAWPPTAPTPYAMAALAWKQHVELVRKQAVGWRSAAAASVMLCIGLAAALSTTLGRPAVAVHIFEVDRSAYIPADPGHLSATAPIDDLAAIELARSTEGASWRASDLVRSAFARPEQIVRPSAATLASSARSKR